MIVRPPACERHAAKLPGTQRMVTPSECPWCWQEGREHSLDKDCWCDPYADTVEPSVLIHRREGHA